MAPSTAFANAPCMLHVFTGQAVHAMDRRFARGGLELPSTAVFVNPASHTQLPSKEMAFRGQVAPREGEIVGSVEGNEEGIGEGIGVGAPGRGF